MDLSRPPIRHHECSRDGYTVSTDRARLDIGEIARFLSEEAYWSPGISRDLVERAIAGSLPFGLYDGAGAQVGFARVVTDGAVFAYVRDVYVLGAHRGRGLGFWLCETALRHPDLAGIRRWMLATEDAHALYAKLGFQPVARPELYMELDR